jgi:anti-sigma factor RsiW
VSCKRTQDELSAYLDGQLPDDGEERVREHLAVCPRCAAELEGLTRLNGLIDGLEEMPVPAGFAARVRRAAVVRPFAAPQPQSIGSILFGGLLTRVAAVLMVVFGLWVGLSMGGAVGSAAGTSDGTAATGVARSSTADADPLDLPVGSLSAAPVGSLTEVYLDISGDGQSEGG